MGKTFSLPLGLNVNNDNFIENDIKCNDDFIENEDTSEFIIKYKCRTIKTSAYYQHLKHLIKECTPADKRYPSHCLVVFRLNSVALYVLNHLLFNGRIVYTKMIDHKIMDYKNNTLRTGEKDKDYQLITRNKTKYYFHPQYDEKYIEKLKFDRSSLLSVEFAMLLHEISMEVFESHDINISISIKANKLPKWHIIANEIRRNVSDILKNDGREIMLPEVTKFGFKNIINSCINQCDFESDIDDMDVAKILDYTNSTGGEIYINVCLKILPNRPIKLLAFYKRALELDGWTKNDINELYKMLSKSNPKIKLTDPDLHYFNKYDKTQAHQVKTRLCKDWLGGNCPLTKVWCTFSHGLDDLHVVFKFIVPAIGYAMNYENKINSKVRAESNEAKDMKILKSYKNKISNIDKYITQKELKQIHKLRQIYRNQFKKLSPGTCTGCIVYLIFEVYSGYPFKCTPDQYYLRGQRPVIKGKEISAIDNKGFVVSVSKDSYVKFQNKKYAERTGGVVVWRPYKQVLLPPPLSSDPLTHGMSMTESQFKNALDESINITDNNNNNTVLTIPQTIPSSNMADNVSLHLDLFQESKQKLQQLPPIYNYGSTEDDININSTDDDNNKTSSHEHYENDKYKGYNSKSSNEDYDN
eukprot:174196_1